MVTLEIGQRIQQSNTTIWEIVELGMRDRYSNEQLWRLRMIEDPRGVRLLGEEVSVSTSWLNQHCIDVNTTVEPPKGNGEQTCRISGWDMLTFTTAEDAIAWFVETLDRGDHGEWWGFATDDATDPDMTVAWNEAGDELVWSE